MKNDIDKLILGFVIGGLIGGSALYLLRANKKEKKQFFDKIGTIVSDVGDLLKEVSVEDKNAALDELAKGIPKTGSLANLLMLAAIGMNVWKKWR